MNKRNKNNKPVGICISSLKKYLQPTFLCNRDAGLWNDSPLSPLTRIFQKVQSSFFKTFPFPHSIIPPHPVFSSFPFTVLPSHSL